MPRFEYRLSNEMQDYPVLYFYPQMDDVEAALRFSCDYFIKEGRTWLKTASAIDAGVLVLYVEEVDSDSAEGGNVAHPALPGGIAVEVRQYLENAVEYPLIHQFGFSSQAQALPHLVADTMMLFGQEWEKTSTEIDEDRQAYVYYCKKTGG